jgi:hypothetical protein
MKIKKLILSVVILSVFLISCSKEEINGVNIQPKESFEQVTFEQVTLQPLTTSTENARLSAKSNLKAYIFIEPISKHSLIKGHLNSVPTLKLGVRKFLGFHDVNRGVWRVNLPNYISMPHWINGNLPRIIESEIPQTSGGFDQYGNEIRAFNFKTIKIPKNTVNDRLSWIVVLIPIEAMNNDTQRQRRINVVEKVNTTIRTNKNYTTDSVLFGTIINYRGNRIPPGQYRVYSTYPSPEMTLNLNPINDVYIRGFN